MSGEKVRLDVLVVDDQPGVRSLLQILVSEAGHTVRLAENGRQAVEEVKKKVPDLVFMDVRMPVMGGLEALERIKVMAPRVEVVLMSAFVADEAVESALSGGARNFLQKPFELQQVLDLLSEVAKERFFPPAALEVM
ncbi:response regulator [Desulfurispora thermophila]|uniref:response regulator n=1 Tax=Desulfurispora thermophila TaxID=265470 RepID=UPI00035D999F|nr:response regulator [Desulfurispora thermophila]